MLTVALPKGRLGSDTQKLMMQSGWIENEIPKDSRKLIFDLSDKIRVLIVRAADVASYVEMGTADIGIVGKDVLLENQPDILEICDLKFGYCRMAVAAMKPTTSKALFSKPFLKVASKYTGVAERFFASKMIHAEIIKLYGSVELSAVTGLADCIVDIVETGKTLKENGLEVVEEIFESSAYLVANRSAYYLKLEEMQKLKKDLTAVVENADG